MYINKTECYWLKTIIQEKLNAINNGRYIFKNCVAEYEEDILEQVLNKLQQEIR